MATFKNALSTGIGTSDSSILTAGNTITVIGMSVANITAGTITASIKVTSGATTAYVVKDAPIPAGSSIIPIGGDQKLVLETGDILKVITNTVSSVDVVLSYLEV